MRQKLLLFCLLFVLCLSVSWCSDYSITGESCEKIKNLSSLILQLTDDWYQLQKDKNEQLQSLQESGIEREQELTERTSDLSERKIDWTERQAVLKEKNAEIVEKENELKKIGRALAESEKARVLAIQARNELEEQQKILEKKSRRSWRNSAIIAGIAFIAGFLIGGR